MPENPIDGVLLIDKPAGITSFGAVDRIKKYFRLKKVGHGGTLDPMATGLLVILINRGTKLAAKILGGDKEYRAEIRWGIRTDTQDITGRIWEEKKDPAVSRREVEKVLSDFRGEIEQVPPMFSALKHRGRPLYQLARQGKRVDRPPRKVTIKELELVEYRPDRIRIRIVSSKGTYIRTLADDLGESLGCGGCLTALRRTRSGRFGVEEAVSLNDLLRSDREKLEARVISPARIIAHYGDGN